MVFIDDGSLSQMIPCGENQEIAEIPGKKLDDDLFHLLASYYVYGVAHPKGCTALLHFMQDILDAAAAISDLLCPADVQPAFYACDILMGKPETHGPTKQFPFFRLETEYWKRRSTCYAQ